MNLESMLNSAISSKISYYLDVNTKFLIKTLISHRIMQVIMKQEIRLIRVQIKNQRKKKKGDELNKYRKRSKVSEK